MNPNKRRLVVCILVLSVAWIYPARAIYSHCEIPCGIYDDKMRITMIAEDITPSRNP